MRAFIVSFPGRRRIAGALTLAAAVAALALVPAGAAAAEVNATGTWQAVYHCEHGACAGQEHSGTFTLQEAAGSSAVSGRLVVEGAEGTVSGTLSANTLTLEGKGEKGYTATGVETISADGLSWSGSYSDSSGTSGTLTATRPSLPIFGAGTLKPSAIQVLCNLDVATQKFTCTAEVGDATEGANPVTTIPTGTVSFTATSGGFSPLAQCQLAATPGAGNVASCSVTYTPAAKIPLNTSPPVTGSYSGDSVFAPSAAKAGTGAVTSPIVGATKVTGEGVKTPVACHGPEGDFCEVELKILLETAAGAASAHKARPKAITIGASKQKLKTGQTRVIAVSLNRAGKKLLAKHKHLTAVLEVVSNGKTIKRQKVQLELNRHK